MGHVIVAYSGGTDSAYLAWAAKQALGFRQFRTRFHGELVRIEIAADELPRALNPQMASRLTAIFKGLGYKYVTLDLQGYRQGSMNEVLVLPSLNTLEVRSQISDSQAS